MYPFSQSVTPAVRSHLDAQVSFFNDVSKSLSRSFQSLCELNIQLSQTLLEEGNIASQKLLTSHNATDALSAAASRAQPASEKLRAYQQHISRIAADAQVDLSRVTEQHVQETSRTARELATEVARVATEETQQQMRKQEETLKNFRDPFQQAAAARGNSSIHASGNLQSANLHGEAHQGGATAHGNIQGEHASQPAGKASGKPN